MAILKIFAQLTCSDLEASSAWYRTLFGRIHDADPMDGLKEWHHGDGAGFQLVSNSDQAGRGSMTLIVSGLADEHERLANAGFKTTKPISGDFASFARIEDPDGNIIVLAEPKTA